MKGERVNACGNALCPFSICGLYRVSYHNGCDTVNVFSYALNRAFEEAINYMFLGAYAYRDTIVEIA